MTDLVPCSACRRHRRGSEACAFCARRSAASLGLVALLTLSACGASEVQKPVVIEPTPTATPAPPPTDTTPPPAPPPTSSPTAGSGRRPPRVKPGEPQPPPEPQPVPLYGCPPPPLDGEFV